MAKLTRKSYKRKKIAFAAVILGGVALVSSGFAAWVLSSNAKDNTAGSVTVGAVEKGNLKLEITSDQGDVKNGHFDFDTLESDKSGRVRVKEGQTTFENLSIAYTIKIKSPIDNFKDLQYTMSATKSAVNYDMKDVSEGEETKYISLPNCFGSTITVEGSNNTLFKKEPINLTEKDDKENNVTYAYQWTTTVTVAFQWGATFGGYNPGLYYDGQITDTTKSTEEISALNAAGLKVTDEVVEAKLNDLKDKLNGATYNIDFVASVN